MGLHAWTAMQASETWLGGEPIEGGAPPLDSRCTNVAVIAQGPGVRAGFHSLVGLRPNLGAALRVQAPVELG